MRTLDKSLPTSRCLIETWGVVTKLQSIADGLLQQDISQEAECHTRDAWASFYLGRDGSLQFWVFSWIWAVATYMCSLKVSVPMSNGGRVDSKWSVSSVVTANGAEEWHSTLCHWMETCSHKQILLPCAFVSKQSCGGRHWEGLSPASHSPNPSNNNHQAKTDHRWDKRQAGVKCDQFSLLLKPGFSEVRHSDRASWLFELATVQLQKTYAPMLQASACCEARLACVPPRLFTPWWAMPFLVVLPAHYPQALTTLCNWACFLERYSSGWWALLSWSPVLRHPQPPTGGFGVPDTPGTLSGHLFDTLEPGVRRNPETLPRTLRFSTLCRTLPETLRALRARSLL